MYICVYVHMMVYDDWLVFKIQINLFLVMQTLTVYKVGHITGIYNRGIFILH